MIEELAGRGYKLSPGTPYPILHGLEKKGYLRSNERRIGAHGSTGCDIGGRTNDWGGGLNPNVVR